MIIEKYGIKLIRLREKDIELVRRMRNRKDIAGKMFYQKHITKAAQQQWFKSINNNVNYFFIINYKKQKIGLIHGKVHSFETSEQEGGIFIWDKKYLNSPLPIIASVLLADFTFLIINMQKTYAEVRSDNHKALNYNLKLGYKIVNSNPKTQKIKLVLTKTAYLNPKNKIRKNIQRLTKDFTDLSLDNIHFDATYYPKTLYQGLPKELLDKFNQIFLRGKTKQL